MDPRPIDRVVLGQAAHLMLADAGNRHLIGAPPCQRHAPPSTEHEIPATPDGPAVAVAVTYCVPAVEAASFGPDSETTGCWLSTSIVRV